MSGARASRWSFARELVLGLLVASATGLASSAVLVALVLLLPGPAAAAAPDGLVRVGEVGRGSLLLSSGQAGLYRYAPTQETDVQLSVSGMIVRARVQQRFHNPHADWVEGIYVFPLPEDAAVDRLRLRIGERLIEGEVRERVRARQQYEQARAQGRKATLVEQERPNVFTSSVANIGPGEMVTVELEYQQHLRYNDGGFQLRFPTVVAPRYIPGRPIAAEVAAWSSHGWAAPSDRVADAGRITPPVVPPGEAARNPLRLRVELDAGFPLAGISSPYHRVRTEHRDETRATVVLQEDAAADRDFALRWRPVAGAMPQAALFRQEHDGRHYLLMMLLPPVADGLAERIAPRELIFVVDTSGSMAGASIGQAREALALALQRLRPEDRFNVIQFNSRTDALFRQSQPADSAHLAAAQRYVAGLQAEGGTEMLPALALALAGQPAGGRLRQVIFLTDGAIGNEQETFALVHARLGEARLFTVGIGSAPNGHFMSRAAQFGRGTFTYIGRSDEVRAQMDNLLRKLEHPALTDIQVTWPGTAVAELWPERLPDLYLGEPLVFSARFPQPPDVLTVTGRFGAEPWSLRLPIQGANESSGTAVLWARKKIAALMDGLAEGTDPEAVREAVVRVALAHHLVSKYTSLVAVDKTPARAPHDLLRSGSVPTNLPAGWQYEKVFGQLPQTATDSLWHLVLGVFLLLVGAGLGSSAWRSAR